MKLMLPQSKNKSLTFKHLSRKTQYASRIVFCVFLLLTACTPAATPTYFIPPTALGTHATATSGANIATPTLAPVESGGDLNNIPTATEVIPTPEPDLPSPTPAGCTNVLTFVEDVTVPDGTVMTAGDAFVKKWRVKNDGSCDWNSTYKLKLVSGDALGGPTETTLYPATAGAEAVIEMNLVVPTTAGPYHTVWQAYDSGGTPFEQAIYVDFVVQ